MSAKFKLNEAIPSAREIVVDLVNPAGTARVTGAAAGAVIKVATPGGNLAVDNGCTLTEITGGADFGPYRLRLSPAALAIVGSGGSWEISNAGVISTEKGEFSVEPTSFLYYGKAVNQSDQTHVDLDPASPGGGAPNTDGYYASLAAGRVCLVRVVAGQGAGQFRLGVDFTGLNRRVTLDSAFAIGLDTSGGANQSYVTVEQVAGGASTASLLNALLSNVMDPTNAGGATYPQNARTFQQQWNLVMAYMFGPGEGLDGTAGSLGPPCVGDPQASPAPHRAEFTVVAGKRRFTKLDGT